MKVTNMKILVCRWDYYILRHMLDEGLEITLLIDAYETAHFPMSEDVLARMANVFLITSYNDMEELAQVVTELRLTGWMPEKVVSLSEFAQFGAAYLATALGLGHPTIPAALATRDKRAMKAAVTSRGVKCADFVSLRSSHVEQSIASVQARFGFPTVVKPAAGFGTLGTQWIHSEDELRKFLTEPASDGLDHFFIAEEPISGDEYHVDAVWVNGVCRTLGVSRYLKPRIDIHTAGVGNGAVLLPPGEWAELYADVTAMHEKVNEALCISDGITHLELFKEAGERELCFSEVATRPGGAAIPQTFKVWGEDMRITWIDSLVSPGRLAPYTAEAQAHYVGWVNIAPQKPGRIAREPSQADIAAFPYVADTIRMLTVGADYTDPHPSAWCLLVVFTARTLEEFERRAAELEAGLSSGFETTER